MATPTSEPYMRVTWTDPETGTKGFVVIDRLVHGIAGGGTRMRAGCTIEEVERLARAMSHKNGALGVAAGGAKCGIDCDPHRPDARDVLASFVRAIRPLLEGTLATAEDMGVSQKSLDGVFAAEGLGLSVHAALQHTGDPDAAMARMRAGFAAQTEGLPVAGIAGGYGVAAATLAGIHYLGWQPAGLRVAIQGFGSIGGPAARYLAGAGLRIVCIADANGAIANPEGLDVERLLGARNEYGEVDRGALGPGDRQIPRDNWLAVEADILVPAAVADAITVENCGRITARLVVEGANIPATAEAERFLHDAGVLVVPDFVANSGTNAWFWWTLQGTLPPGAGPAFERLDATMRRAVPEILDAAKRDGVTPREAAERIAMATLDRLAAAPRATP